MFILKRVAFRTDTKTYQVYSMKTYPICDSPFNKRSARHSFAPLQQPRRNYRFYV